MSADDIIYVYWAGYYVGLTLGGVCWVANGLLEIIHRCRHWVYDREIPKYTYWTKHWHSDCQSDDFWVITIIGILMAGAVLSFVWPILVIISITYGILRLIRWKIRRSKMPV